MNLILRLLNSFAKKIKHYFISCRNYLRQQIYPGFYAKKANKIIDKDYTELIAQKVKPFSANINVDDALKQLQSECDAQMERKKTIEDKAKSILATISISITAITFSLNYEAVSYKSAIEIVSLVLLLLSVLYFIMGTIRAIQTINIRAFHVFQTETKITNDEIELVPIGTNSKQLEDLLKAKLLNDKIILKLGNFAWASFNLVRNGIVLFALYFIVSLVKKSTHNSNGDIPCASRDTISIVLPKGVISQLAKSRISIAQDSIIISKIEAKSHDDTNITTKTFFEFSLPPKNDNQKNH